MSAAAPESRMARSRHDAGAHRPQWISWAPRRLTCLWLPLTLAPMTAGPRFIWRKYSAHAFPHCQSWYRVSRIHRQWNWIRCR
jgi:hypothetical protein